MVVNIRIYRHLLGCQNQLWISKIIQIVCPTLKAVDNFCLHFAAIYILLNFFVAHNDSEEDEILHFGLLYEANPKLGNIEWRITAQLPVVSVDTE